MCIYIIISSKYWPSLLFERANYEMNNTIHVHVHTSDTTRVLSKKLYSAPLKCCKGICLQYKFIKMKILSFASKILNLPTHFLFVNVCTCILRQVHDIRSTLLHPQDLFFKFPWNNFLHSQVEGCISAAVSSTISPTDDGSGKTENNGNMDAFSLKHHVSIMKYIYSVVLHVYGLDKIRHKHVHAKLLQSNPLKYVPFLKNSIFGCIVT